MFFFFFLNSYLQVMLTADKQASLLEVTLPTCGGKANKQEGQGEGVLNGPEGPPVVYTFGS